MASPLVAIVRCLLPIINRVHTIVLGIRPVGRSSVISVEVRRHKGSLIRLHDGCEVRPGAPVIKLHFNNAWIAEGLLRSGSGSRAGGFPRGLIYYFKEGLQLLATDVGNGKYDGIVAVYGWTAFHAHAGRLGFQVIDLPNTLRIKLAGLHVRALMQSQRIPWFRTHMTSARPVQIRAVWLSRGELLRIHGSPS